MEKYYKCTWKDCLHRRIGKNKKGDISVCIDTRGKEFCMFKGELIKAKLY